MASYRRKRSTSRRKAKTLRARRTIKRKQWRRKPALKRRSGLKGKGVARSLRAISRSVGATARATKLDATGRTFIKLHTSRKRYMKSYVFKKLMQLNPLVRQATFPETTVIDTSTMSINQYNTATNAINGCGWALLSVTQPVHYGKFLDIYLKSLGLGALTHTDESQTVYYKKGNVTAEFKNENKQPCELDIWVFYPRRDLAKPQTAGQTYGVLQNSLTVNQGGTGPLLYWSMNNADSEADSLMGSGTGINADQTAVGSRDQTPFNASEWCALFRASKTRPRHVTLQGGQSITISLTDWYSRAINCRKYGIFDGTYPGDVYNYFKENGPVVLVRVRGCLIHDESLPTNSMAYTSLAPAYGAYSVTAGIKYTYDLVLPRNDPEQDFIPPKMRMQTGVYGFTGSAPYNTMTITNADTRDKNQTEGAFNT